jgi:hypothetical protein
MVSQQLVNPTCKTAAELVAWFGAVQGQEYAQTKWGLGIRLPHLLDSDVEKEINDGLILRTHLLRPTWHLVAAVDIRWLLQLTAPRVHAANAYMYRQLELDNKIFNVSNNVLVKSLEGGKYLTRTSLNEELRKHKIKAEGHRLSYIMMRAELDGIICSGPRDGNQSTYALLDERVPSVNHISREQALEKLTKRYIKSRGPVTTRDFSTWSGLTVTEAKKGFDIVGSHFIHETLDTQQFLSATYALPDKAVLNAVYLLPIYDEFIMGYKDRSAMLAFRNKLETKPSVGFDSTIVSNGQIIGTWKRVMKGKCLELGYNFFKPPTKLQLASLRKSVNRLEAFTGLITKEKQGS